MMGQSEDDSLIACDGIIASDVSYMAHSFTVMPPVSGWRVLQQLFN
jgi:hypothetical protein